MNLHNLKRIHFIGIGGIGISYLAYHFLHKGVTVSGSDIARSIITDRLAQAGASVFEGHSADHIPQDTDLVIYNDAIPGDNVELVRARAMGIEMRTNFQVVGELSKDYTTIVVAGNKGKTTTSAMLATMLANAGCDPTAMIGSLVNDWNCNYRAGGDRYLVVEGDEYKEHFLEIDADIAVITNMMADHLDYFGTPAAVVEAFQKFVDKLPKDGLLVINADDEMTKELRMPDCKVLKVSLALEGDLNAQAIKSHNGRQTFGVLYGGHDLGEWELKFPGRFNVANALAASMVALHLEIKPEQIREALKDFAGTWRRFQVLGEYKDAVIVSDYAHHPAAVHATIEAAKDFYPGRRLVAVFQPHTRHRTKALFDDFVSSFDEADVVLLPEIFDVAGREVIPHEEMNAEMLASSIRGRGRTLDARASGDLQNTKKMVENLVQSGDILLVMGAGDVYKMAEELV